MATFSTIMKRAKWLLQLILVINWMNSVKTFAKFAMEPQDQSALIGSRVILPCRIENLKGVVQWTLNQFGLGIDRQLPGFDRYSMIGSDDEGDYSLEIQKVALEDDGFYQCQVSDRGVELRSNTAKLTVLVPPEAPIIEESLKPFNISENEVLKLTCISNGGKPAAEITWIDGLGNVITDGINYTTEVLQDGYRYKSVSRLHMPMKRTYHQTVFKCQAQNTAERTHRTAKIKINVTYAPKITLSVISDRNENGQIVEGADVVIECNTDSNPLEVSYRWFSNEKLLKKKRSNSIEINNITKDYHNTIIKCEANNSIGKSEESETLNVAYAPVFRSSIRTIAAEENNVINLFCDVDSNPPSKIMWYHEHSDRVLSNNDNFTLTVGRNSTGKYRCVAEAKGFNSITTETIVLLKGPPSISAKPIIFATVSDRTELYCSAMAVPVSESIIWSLNGDSLMEYVKRGDISISEESFVGGIKSTIIINKIDYRLFGEYRCSIRNQYGSDIFKITLAQSAQDSIISMAITILGLAVIVISALASLVIYCTKRCRKNTTNKGPISSREKSFENQHDLQLTTKSKNDVKISIDGSAKAIEASNDSKYSSSSTVQIDANCNDTSLFKTKSNSNYLRCQQYSNNIGIDSPYPDIGLPMNKPKLQNMQERLDFPDISFTMFPKTSTYHQSGGGSLNNIVSNTIQQPQISAKVGNRFSVTNEISATYRQVPQVVNTAVPMSTPNAPHYPYITHLIPNYLMQQNQYLSPRSQQYSTLPLHNHIDNSFKRSHINMQQYDGANHNTTLPNVVSSVLKRTPPPPIVSTSTSTITTNAGLLLAPKAYHYNNVNGNNNNCNNNNNNLGDSLKKQTLVIASTNDQNSHVIVNNSQNSDETVKTSTAVIV